MRIWAFPSFYPFDAPGEKWKGVFAQRQYKGLVDNGAELQVIIPVPWFPLFPFYLLHKDWREYAALNYPKKRVQNGITVHQPRIANMRPNRFVKKSFYERTLDSITNFFKDNNIVLDPKKDIFYSQWLPNSAIINEAARRMGVKSAVLGIGDDIIIYPHEKPEFFEIFKKTWTEADNRFVVADYLGKEANKLIGADLPYDVVFMGVEHDFFKPGLPADILATKKEYKIPTDKPIIITIGSAIKRKGWLDLFDAEQQIKKTNNNFFQVAIHGGTPEFDLTEEATKRGLGENFLDLGEVSPLKMNKLFNTADIFCLPSHWEGMANANIEAMSSGLPVITTDVSGHPELINNGVNGILIPANQPAVLAAMLSSLLADKDKRELLGKNARAFIVNTWGNFEHNSAIIYRVLERALAK